MRHLSQNKTPRRSLLPPPPLRAWLFGISLLAAVTVLALLGECGAASDPDELHDATPGASAGKAAAPPAGNNPPLRLEAEGNALAPASRPPPARSTSPGTLAIPAAISTFPTSGICPFAAASPLKTCTGSSSA